jgi:hypothetical protein
MVYTAFSLLIYSQACQKFPILETFHDTWPVEDIAQGFFKNCSQYSKAKHRRPDQRSEPDVDDSDEELTATNDAEEAIVAKSKKKPMNRKIILESDSSDTEPIELVLGSDSEDTSIEQETEEVEEAPVVKGKKKADKVMTMKEFLADVQCRGIVLASTSTSCLSLQSWIICLWLRL